MTEPAEIARACVEVRYYPRDALGPQEYFVSVKTTDGTWTFLSAHRDKAGADLCADIVANGIAAAIAAERAQEPFRSTLARHLRVLADALAKMEKPR